MRWTLSRVIYDMTVLGKHVALPMEVVLEAASSAVQTQEPAASVIASGIANLKAMPALPGFAPPQDATMFQFFLSLRAGGVQTLREFNALLAFLSDPANQTLAAEFDELLDWPHVRDLGAFVHTGWVAEANKDSPDWSPWLEAFDQALTACELFRFPLYGAQIARAKSIVLSEYAGDLAGGFGVLDRATDLFGPSAVIEEQRINLIGQSDDHGHALSAWAQPSHASAQRASPTLSPTDGLQSRPQSSGSSTGPRCSSSKAPSSKTTGLSQPAWGFSSTRRTARCERVGGDTQEVRFDDAARS